MVSSTTFFVADASWLPFKEASFDRVCSYGVLHHLPDPGIVCGQVERILKNSGLFLLSENNKTIFRGIFDWLMRFKPLWRELAGQEPLISQNMLRDWFSRSSLRLQCRTRVFLPPHLFNRFSVRTAKKILILTDQVADHIPFIRRQGGLIVAEARKP